MLVQLRLIAVPQWITEKILIRYEGNGLSRYDVKEYLESAYRIKEKDVRGPLKIGDYVTIKTKCCIWKAVVVNTNPNAPPKKKDSSYFVGCSVGIFSSSW